MTKWAYSVPKWPNGCWRLRIVKFMKPHATNSDLVQTFLSAAGSGADHPPIVQSWCTNWECTTRQEVDDAVYDECGLTSKKL